MTDQADSTPDVIEDVSPDFDGSCGPDDEDICWDDDNYATCSNGQWLVRPCAAGTSCMDSDSGPYCG